MDFVGLLPVMEKRVRAISDRTVILRDSLQLTTWLCVGAVLQSAAFLTIGRLSLLPAAGVLLYRIIETYAITTGLKHNPYMEDVINNKFSAQFPDSQGRYGNKPGRSDVAVLLIGTQSNHPLGIFAPGFKEVGEHFLGMTKELQDNASATGFLGNAAYAGTGRSTNNVAMNVMYFDSADSVHAFANGKSHRRAWDWWTKVEAAHPHISIFHELYHVPRGYWESIYHQSRPVGVAATSIPVKKGDGGEEEVAWMSPVVDASKGPLRSSAGRMGRNLSSEKE